MKQNTKPTKIDILRFIIPYKYKETEKTKDFQKMIKLVSENNIKTKFVLTLGAFLRVEWPKDIDEGKIRTQIRAINGDRKIFLPTIDKIRAKLESVESINIFTKNAEKRILSFFNEIGQEHMQLLTDSADFITIGVDFNEGETLYTIELVGVYDLKNKKFVGWTGKSYPVKEQMIELIKISDLNSHFMELGGESVMVLGCFDLTVFSNRTEAVVTDAFKTGILKEMRRLVIEKKPSIVLQHPHQVFSPTIWRTAWSGLLEIAPWTRSYASGINHTDPVKTPSDLNKVLCATKMGRVVDFVAGSGFRI